MTDPYDRWCNKLRNSLITFAFYAALVVGAALVLALHDGIVKGIVPGY